jgi:GDP-mannose 6-dehydrogenase
MRIAVFGIGYVGAVSAACLARDGHDVVAVDIDEGKVATMQAGQSPIVEPGLADLIDTAVAAGRLRATIHAADAVANSDMCLVCVGTPSRHNGSLDTRFVERVADEIGTALGERSGYSVVVRSTILPGTMEHVVKPRIAAAAGASFGFGYYPEFLREGSAIADYDAPGVVVFGADDEETLERLRVLQVESAPAPRVVSVQAAEMIKYGANALHATKISFANELGLICKAFGVDSHEVMDVLLSDTKLNVSAAYLQPGFAFGGSCLPKDLRALRHRARQQDLETPLLDGVLKANDQVIERAFEMVTALPGRRVGFIGLSFKPETDDLRHSPLVTLAEQLIGRGYDLRIFDPIVRPERLTGANKRYIGEQLPHISEILLGDVEALLTHSDTVVIGNRREAEPVLDRLLRAEVPVVDLTRVSRDLVTRGSYQGLSW